MVFHERYLIWIDFWWSDVSIPISSERDDVIISAKSKDQRRWKIERNGRID